MSRICLDTSAYSNFKRGHQEATDVIDRATWIGVPSIVLGELHAGFQLGGHRARNEEELREFLAHPVVNVLDVDEPAARVYADIVVALRKAGRPIPTNDIWIAAVTAREGATLLTCDEHFRAVGRIAAHVLAESPERRGRAPDGRTRPSERHPSAAV